MLILLSPAKTLDYSDFELNVPLSSPRLINDSKLLLKELKKLSKSDISKLMSVSEKISSNVYSYIHDFNPNFTKKNSKPAILAFKGGVYKAFDFSTYKKSDITFMDKSVRILSGFYGVLKPFDLMQAYRLEMGRKLKVAKTNNLYEFWEDKVVDLLNQDLKTSKSKYILNLASNEYFKVVNQSNVNAEIINIAFKEKKGKEYKVIGIFAKRARGLMTDYIVKNKIKDLNGIKKFNIEKYKFSKSLSTDKELVFIRG